MDFLKQHLNNATKLLEAKNTTNKKRGNKPESAGPISKKQKVQSHPQHQFNHMIAAKKVVVEEEKKRGIHRITTCSYTTTTHTHSNPPFYAPSHTHCNLVETMKMLALTIPKKKNKKQMKRLMNSIPSMKKSKKLPIKSR